jgi:hypothetical protein
MPSVQLSQLICVDLISKPITYSITTIRHLKSGPFRPNENAMSLARIIYSLPTSLITSITWRSRA